jgi:outer membrane protein assembly factor BamB
LKLLLILFLALLHACGGKDNISPPTELVDLDSNLEIKKNWSRDTGKGLSKYYLHLNPLISTESIVVVNSDGRVSAYKSADGTSLWKNNLDEAVTAGVNGGDGIVIVGTDEGGVIGLSSDTGEEVWRQQLPSQVTAISAVEQGMLVARSGDGYFYALDKATGKIRWKLHRPSPPLSLHSQSVPLLEEGVIIAGLDNGQVIMISQDKGAVVWEKTIAPASGRSELERMVDIDGRIDLHDSVVYAVTYNGKIAALDARSGRTQWRQDASSPNGLLVDGEQVFYTDENSVVWALERSSGATLWKQEALKFRSVTTPEVVGDKLVVADYEGYLHWLDRTSGHFLARKRIDRAGVLAMPRVSGEQLVVLGKGGKLSSWSVPE